MFEANPYQMQVTYDLADKRNARISPTAVAVQMYRTALLRGLVGRILSKLTGRSRRLLDLNSLPACQNSGSRRYAGTQPVLIRQICGSEGRTADFDAELNPLHENSRDRWVSVAAAMLRGVALPAVELIQVGEVYYVRDGHHRISAARALGQEAIDAHVTSWDAPANKAAQPAAAARLAIQGR
jgi:hypothetical protein